MAEERRLHLGCGQVYKPGYVNVDRFDDSVADEKADLLDLPHADGSFDSAEAFHVLEHFDHVHAKYFLAEVYRVLRPGGRLVVETPDLEESLRTLSRSDDADATHILQWIYGQDSPGMQHKTGFSYPILEGTLQEAGFVDVRREEPTSHTYEPGLRVTCKRNAKDSGHLLKATIRHSVRRRLPDADSYVLFPLEDTLKEIFRTLEDENAGIAERTVRSIALATVQHPLVGAAVLEALESTGMIDPEKATMVMTNITHLASIDYKGRLFAIWCRSRKGTDPDGDFRRFFADQTRQTALLLEQGEELRETSYLLDIRPLPVPLLEKRIILMEAMKEFYLGVKGFSAGDLDDAEKAFRRSADINPWNPFPNWNLARLSTLKGARTDIVVGFYGEAIRRAMDGSLKKDITHELETFRAERGKGLPTGPALDYTGCLGTVR